MNAGDSAVTTTLYWMRKDFRLSDNAALDRALEADGPVIPVCLYDEVAEGYGAAPKWRWGEAIRYFASALEDKGSRLILRRGSAVETLRALIAETGATRVVWGRQYDRAGKERDAAVKSALKDDGIEAFSVRNHTLFDPWDIESKTGTPYRVYTPFKNRCLERETFGDTIDVPASLKPPSDWPASDALDDWGLGDAMNRGAAVVAEYAVIGEEAARGRLGAFIQKVEDYNDARDRPDIFGTSRLSENLAWGEISPLTIWTAVEGSKAAGTKGAQVYQSEILWREFAYHLTHYYPNIGDENWREEWNAFPWRGDTDDADAWRRGRTGITFVDAAMRELYTTGYMHNRLRMLAASLLTKNLMTDWRIGEQWFAECLIDWDPCSNAMGWQWAAGSGPDAAPFFRIFNPDTQQDKFDPKGLYRRQWLAETSDNPSKDARNFFDAIPHSWDMSADMKAPKPIVDLKAGRERALAAYKDMRA